jgi:thiol-disulfide isomerase/thioredoxin
MVRSVKFWIGAATLAIIPLLIIDISQHAIDWQHEVRDELIFAVQNTYNASNHQKAEILDRAFERNQTLYFLMYAKAVSTVVLLAMAIWFFRLYGKEDKSAKWKPIVAATTLMAVFVLTKVFVINPVKSNAHIKFLQLAPGEYAFQKIYNDNFKGKVVYIDFWGTTCGPCLQEFRNFTKPLKEKYKSRTDIAFLYISQGNRYLWNEQIRKYNIEGAHIFLDYPQYEKLFRYSMQDSTATVLIPRYMIIDKTGKVAVASAHQPSDKDTLYSQLNKYLNQN